MHIRNSIFKYKMKRLQIPEMPVHEKFYLHRKMIHAKNSHCKFITNLLPEKSKENM